jgi:hypothetical protein
MTPRDRFACDSARPFIDLHPYGEPGIFSCRSETYAGRSNSGQDAVGGMNRGHCDGVRSVSKPASSMCRSLRQAEPDPESSAESKHTEQDVGGETCSGLHIASVGRRLGRAAANSQPPGPGACTVRNCRSMSNRLTIGNVKSLARCQRDGTSQKELAAESSVNLLSGKSSPFPARPDGKLDRRRSRIRASPTHPPIESS